MVESHTQKPKRFYKDELTCMFNTEEQATFSLIEQLKSDIKFLTETLNTRKWDTTIVKQMEV